MQKQTFIIIIFIATSKLYKTVPDLTQAQNNCEVSEGIYFFGGINCRNNDAVDVTERSWRFCTKKGKNRTNCCFGFFFLSVLSVHKNFHTYLSPSFSIKCLAVTSIEEKVFPAPQLATGALFVE